MEETTPQANSRNNNSKFLIPIAVVIIVLVIIAFVSRGGQRTQNTTSEPSPESMTEEENEVTSTAPTTSDIQNSSTQKYKDGVYETTGNYMSPGGSENLGVKITLKDGIITDADVESRATRPTTVKFQGLFVSNYKPQVIGKNIDDAELTTVSGSSLSPKGFNEALDEIKEQAS